MNINYEKNTIVLYGRVGKLDVLIKKLAGLSGEQLYHFLTNRGIQIPRRLNIYALYSMLNRKIVNLSSNDLSRDYFLRLKYYNTFSETLLYNLAMKLNVDETDFLVYRLSFIKLLIDNNVGLDLTDGELTYLKNLRKLSTESFEKYFTYISSASLEQNNTFDGVDINVLKGNLISMASNQDLSDIVMKYGIDLPKRLSKEMMIDYVVYNMKKKTIYNKSIEAKLSEMSIEQIETYAERNNFKISQVLTKEDSINYLFYYLSMCEINTTSLNNIICDEFLPLEFEIIEGNLNNFNKNNNLNVIKCGDIKPNYISNIILAKEVAKKDTITNTQKTVSEDVVVNDVVEEKNNKTIEVINEEDSDELDIYLSDEIDNKDEDNEVVEEVVVSNNDEEVEDLKYLSPVDINDDEIDTYFNSFIDEINDYVSDVLDEENLQREKELIDKINEMETDDLVAQILKEGLEEVETKEEISHKYDFLNKVFSNEMFASMKLDKLRRSHLKGIILTTCSIFVMVLVVVGIWLLNNK